jgi:hypothetical protein
MILPGALLRSVTAAMLGDDIAKVNPGGFFRSAARHSAKGSEAPRPHFTVTVMVFLKITFAVSYDCTVTRCVPAAMGRFTLMAASGAS